jgi:acetyl-CoA synthetase
VGDVFWCTADCGWITGHSYVTYGPLLNCATQIIFEGIPTHPTPYRFWDLVQKHRVNQFYTAPTVIRSLMSVGSDAEVKARDLSSLRVLGSVGEPINPDPWRWYHSVVGGGRCPIVDTWWQTETGGHMITPLPYVTPLAPGSATLPFFGVQPVILDTDGNELEGICSGILAIKSPWPGMMRTVLGDHDRFESTYFSAFKGYYFTGDGCRRDKNGYYWYVQPRAHFLPPPPPLLPVDIHRRRNASPRLTGRVDDVINVSGHRIGTAEVENALTLHHACTEAATVGYPHPIKGEGLYCYVCTKPGVALTAELKNELKEMCRREIGAFATPDVIHFAATGLPKTRSGKIMRRILRKIAAGDISDLGDTSTLTDPSVVDALISTKNK